MQAMHVSGQTTELRDPLPVKDLASGEVDNSEHPFMKLLAGLRNAMKQGDEAARNVLDEKSRLNQDASSKLKSMKDSAPMTVIGQERSDGTQTDDSGLQRNAVLGVRNGSAKVLEGRGQEESAVRKSGQADFDGRSLSYIPGGNAAPKSSESGALVKAAGSGSGKTSELLAEGTLNQNAALIDKYTLSDSGDSAVESKKSRSPEGAAEGSSRRRNLDAAGSLDRTSLAASGSVNGSMNPVGLNRSDNLAASMDKSSLDKSVDGARSSDRRPTRYSVVDMRLKAIAGKASQDASAEGKPEGKPGGTTGSELNRNGLSGTDAAGRQIRNDQAAGGFSEAVK